MKAPVFSKTANHTQIKILRASPELKSEEIKRYSKGKDRYYFGTNNIQAFHEPIFVKCIPTHVSNEGLVIMAEEYLKRGQVQME